MNRILKAGVIAVAGLLCLPLAASAQSGSIDTSSGPNYAIISLNGPLDLGVVPLLSGGGVDAGGADLGTGCVGNIFESPDVQVTLQDSEPTLRVYFTALESGQDTTLVVQAPDGSFACNDDFDGSNPLVEIPGPQAGDYYVWVGTFGSQNNYPGFLVATTGDSMPGALSSDVLGTGTGGQTAQVVPTVDPNDPLAQVAPTLTAAANLINQQMADVGPTLTAAANLVNNLAGTPGSQANFNNVFGNNAAATPAPNSFGNTSTAVLAAGFTPDPMTVPLAAGGSLDARTLGPDCRGYIAEAPNYVIAYGGGGSLLRIFFASDGDTTLVVQLPDGTFACNDDFPGDLDALVDVANPPAGSYVIWVGTYNEGETLNGDLVITGSTTVDPTTSGK